MATPLRYLYRKLVPHWLQDDKEGAPLLYSLGLILESFVEKMRQGRNARFPEDAPSDALVYFARDRRLVRGIQESRESFNARLIRWLDDHATRGNPFALMRQLRNYCNAAVRVRTVDVNGNWYTIDRDGTESFSGDWDNWDWDGSSSDRWARFWVIIYPTSDGLPWSEGPSWGDPGLVWGTPGATWGTTATVQEVGEVRRIVRDWKPAGTRCEHIIIAFDDSSFNPVDSFGLPDGTWSSAANRLSSARYWRGTREAA